MRLIFNQMISNRAAYNMIGELSGKHKLLSFSVPHLSGGVYNPAHTKPLYIARQSNGHIQPSHVEMKEGYGCSLCRNGLDKFGYEDVLVLHQFIDSKGHLINKRVTGVCRRMQNKLAKCIKRARRMGYLPKVPSEL